MLQVSQYQLFRYSVFKGVFLFLFRWVLPFRQGLFRGLTPRLHKWSVFGKGSLFPAFQQGIEIPFAPDRAFILVQYFKELYRKPETTSAHLSVLDTTHAGLAPLHNACTLAVIGCQNAEIVFGLGLARVAFRHPVPNFRVLFPVPLFCFEWIGTQGGVSF